MNWITISVVLTVLVCISFDNGYVASEDTTPTTTQAIADNSQSSDGDNGSGTDNSGDGGTVDSTDGDDGTVGGHGGTDQSGTNNANSGTTETNNANSGTTETNNDGNSGSGGGELSAKVLMIATMAGCTLAVYGGL